MQQSCKICSSTIIDTRTVYIVPRQGEKRIGRYRNYPGNTLAHNLLDLLSNPGQPAKRTFTDVEITSLKALGYIFEEVEGASA